MAKAKGLYAKVAHEPIFHKTSIGRNPSLAKELKDRRYHQRVVKNKKAYDRKKLIKISSGNS